MFEEEAEPCWFYQDAGSNAAGQARHWSRRSIEQLFVRPDATRILPNATLRHNQTHEPGSLDHLKLSQWLAAKIGNSNLRCFASGVSTVETVPSALRRILVRVRHSSWKQVVLGSEMQTVAMRSEFGTEQLPTAGNYAPSARYVHEHVLDESAGPVAGTPNEAAIALSKDLPARAAAMRRDASISRPNLQTGGAGQGDGGGGSLRRG